MEGEAKHHQARETKKNPPSNFAEIPGVLMELNGELAGDFLGGFLTGLFGMKGRRGGGGGAHKGPH